MREAELVVTFVTRLVATNIMQILSFTHMYNVHKTILHVRYFSHKALMKFVLLGEIMSKRL